MAIRLNQTQRQAAKAAAQPIVRIQVDYRFCSREVSPTLEGLDCTFKVTPSTAKEVEQFISRNWSKSQDDTVDPEAAP